MFTVLGAGAGLGVGLAADLAGGFGGAISRDAMTPVLILTTLAGAGLGYYVANQTAPCL